MAELWALDTNVYIGALRDRDRLARLKRFLIRAGTRLRVSGVVALELRAGARTAGQETAVNDLIAAYVTRDRGIVPSLSAYVEGGRVLAALGAREGVDVSRAGSLVNDVLIATSCREAGVQLVTGNASDFALIQRYLRGFRFVATDDALT
jgi:predicted nucleic acid-binding protein